MAKTLVGSVAFSDDEKAVALVLPGGSCINPTYDGDFPVPNRPGWFFVWDEAGKTLVEKELGEIFEFDRVDMEILGNKVPFVIGTDRNADIREPWEEIGIEALTCNPENKNIKDSVMKMFTATMWMVSDATRGGKTYEVLLLPPRIIALSSIYVRFSNQIY